MNLGEKIKEYRKKINLTQEELSTILEISKHTLSKYEQNQRKPSIEILNKIAIALGVTINDLAKDESTQYVNGLNRHGANIDKIDLSKISTKELIKELNKRTDFELNTK